MRIGGGGANADCQVQVIVFISVINLVGRCHMRGISWKNLISDPYRLAIWISAAVYAIAFSVLSYLKYYTFNATYLDIGLQNQVQWLLSHGGIQYYYSSRFNLIYPLQFSRPILFLVTPFYSIYPHPETLLVIGSLALGFAAVPLYLFAKRRLNSKKFALIVALSYFIYFPVASGNLFDFHYQELFPVLFFCTLASWSYKSMKSMYFFAALTACVNPLTLLIVIFFLLYTTFGARTISFSLSSISQWLKSWLTTLKADKVKLLFIASLIAVLVIYKLSGTLYTAGVGESAPGASLDQLILFNIGAKLQVVLYLYGALAFIPLFSLRSQVVLLPYFGFVLLSMDSANWATFGLQYTLMATGPLYFSLVESLKSLSNYYHSSISEGLDEDIGLRNSNYKDNTPAPVTNKLLVGLVVTSIVFGIVYFPLSPVNSYVSGGLFSGNHNLAEITSSTPQTDYLWKVINLIPPTAAVLSQNDIPQVTGRQFSQIASLYNSSIPYDYLLMDTSLNYFTTANDIIPIANEDLASGSFGIVAEGQGALLIARGYHQAPRLFLPLNITYLGKSFNAFSAHRVGDTLVGNVSSASMWYGPYTTLYPGSYIARFTIGINSTNNSSSRLITLDVTANNGRNLLASTNIYAADFSMLNHTATFELFFNSTSIVQFVEFRGMEPSGLSVITLYKVQIVQDSLG